MYTFHSEVLHSKKLINIDYFQNHFTLIIHKRRKIVSIHYLLLMWLLESLESVCTHCSIENGKKGLKQLR